MKNINTKIIIIAVLIDVVGTTIVQVLLQTFSLSQVSLIAAGGMVSICAGYFLVSKIKKVDTNLYLLAASTFLTGIIFLLGNNVLFLDNFYWLLLTPILNLVGGFLASKFAKTA